MESFVLKGNMDSICRMLKFKEQMEKAAQDRQRDARRIKVMSIINSLPLNVEGLNGHTN